MLNRTLRLLAVVVPISVLFMVLRHEIVMVLFQRGNFDAKDTALTSGILVYLLVGAYAFSAQTVVVRGFYAVQNTLFPAIFGTLAVLFGIPLYLAGMKFFDVKGIALAISLSVIIQIWVLYGVWNKKTANEGAKSVYTFILKMVMLSIPMGIVMEGVKVFLTTRIDAASLFGSILIAGIVGVLFFMMIPAVGYALKIEEINYLANHFFSYFREKTHKLRARVR